MAKELLKEQELYDVGGGKYFPIKGYIATDALNKGKLVDKNHPGAVPLVDIPQMSDFKWQYGCLMSRLEHPEHYKDIDTDVSAVIEKLKLWLIEHIDCSFELGEEKRKELLDILSLEKMRC